MQEGTPQFCNIPTLSLSPWQVTLISQGFFYYCQVWSKVHFRPEGKVAWRPFPAPVHVLTWVLSQPWDVGGHDEHNYADEDSHCPVRHHTTSGAEREGLVAQGCSRKQGGGGGGEEPLPQMCQPLLASGPSLSPSTLGALPTSFPPPLAR